MVLGYTNNKINSTKYHYFYPLEERVPSIVSRPRLYINPLEGLCFAVYILLDSYKLQKILLKFKKTGYKQIRYICFPVYKIPEYRLKDKSLQVNIFEIDFKLLIGFRLFFRIPFQHSLISLQIDLYLIIVDSNLNKPSF